MELSNRLKVKPLKDGEVKIFKLVNSGKVDVMTGQPAMNSGGTFKGYFTITDKFEENHALRRKVLKNVIATQTVLNDKGKEEVKEIIGDIEFGPTGLCIVKPDEYNKLVVMMRADENLSNKYRNNSKPAIWEEVEPTPSILKLIEKLDIEDEARMFAKNGDIKEVISVLNILKPGNKLKEISDIRYALRLLAIEKPKEVIRHSKNREMKLRILVKECYEEKLIDFVDETLEWHIVSDDTKSSLIHKSEVGVDPETDFIDFLKKTPGITKKLNDLLNAVQHETMEVLV